MAGGLQGRGHHAGRRLGGDVPGPDAPGWLSNHWITLHETNNIAGFTPIIVMDAWEHAFVPDYKANERAKYVEAYFSNIDWEVAESRLK